MWICHFLKLISEIIVICSFPPLLTLVFCFSSDYSKSYSPSESTKLINSLKELNGRFDLNPIPHIRLSESDRFSCDLNLVNTVQLILGPQGATDKSQTTEFLRQLGKAGLWIQYDMRNVKKEL
jgi:hypothetical protein